MDLYDDDVDVRKEDVKAVAGWSTGIRYVLILVANLIYNIHTSVRYEGNVIFLAVIEERWLKF